MDTGNYHTDLLADLYKARKARKEALVKYNGGSCPFLRVFVPDLKNMPCKNDPPCTRQWVTDTDDYNDGYMQNFQLRKDCSTSIEIQKNAEEYHKAANRAGAALRACLKEGKYIAELKP